MTARLDIVTNDAGELVRREHARDLGAGVVVAIYRLAKLAQLHDLTNQAFLRQLEDTHKLIVDYCLRSGSNVSILFARRAIFVAGQLLKGSRGAYESASELGDILEWCGGSELAIAREITVDELRAFAEAISQAMRGEKGKGFRSPSPRIRLRAVADAARLRGLELEVMSIEQRIVRAYASAVVIMRRFFEDLAAGRYVLPRRVKRIAQNLVDLSDGSTPSFLGVTEARNANHDDAGRAVNTAILAVSIAREMTDDRALLSQVAMAAMMHDAGRPRAIRLAASSGPQLTGVVAKLTEDAEDKLAAGTAAVLTTLGRVNEATITRTVIAYEALWQRRRAFVDPLYEGVRAPTLQAKIVALARRYNDLLTPEPGLAPPSPDFAVATMANELREPADRTVLRMLVASVGIYPAGTVVQLDDGRVGEVMPNGDRRAPVDKPRVRVVMDADGGVLDRPLEIDLAAALTPSARKGEGARSIARVVSVDGWKKTLADHARGGGDMHAADHEAPISRAPDTYAPQPAVASFVPEPHESKPDVAAPDAHSTSDEPASVGTSPSAVGQSFGRHMTEPPSSKSPPTVRPPRLGDRISPQPTSQPHAPPITASAPREGAEPARAVIPVPPGGAARDPLEGHAPTAKGTLAATPLVHVLVYMLDHSLSGTVVFREPDGGESLGYFFEGSPAKIKTRKSVALLGEELVADGIVDRDVATNAVESARRLGAMLGEYLVANAVITEDALAKALQRQLKKKLVSLVNLLPDTTYSFYRDVNALHAWAGDELVDVHPLDAILACARGWHDRARIYATLGRIGKQPLTLHSDVDLSALELTDEEESALAILRGENPTLASLNDTRVADEDTIGSLVYMLAVTRQFAFAKGEPMGRDHSVRARAAKDAASTERVSALPLQAIVDPSHARGGAAATKPSVAPVVTGKSKRDAKGAGTWRPPRSGAPPVAEDGEIEIDVVVESESATVPPPAIPSVTPSPMPVSAREPSSDETSSAALQAMTDFRLAETALQRSDLKVAERLAARATEGDPDRGEYAALLVWIRAAKATSAATTVEAIEALGKVLEKEPGNERALLYRGKLAKRANRVKDALRDFDAILMLNPKHLEAASEARLLRARKPTR